MQHLIKALARSPSSLKTLAHILSPPKHEQQKNYHNAILHEYRSEQFLFNLLLRVTQIWKSAVGVPFVISSILCRCAGVCNITIEFL